MLMVTEVHLVLCLGSWLVAKDVEIAYWHILVDLSYCSFLAVQQGRTILQFIVLLFGLNSVAKVFTNLDNRTHSTGSVPPGS